MALFQAVVIGLIALIITPGYLFYFDVTPKVAVLLAGTGLLLLGTVAARPAHRLFSLLLLLNAVSLGVSTAFSTEPALSAFGTNWRRFGAVPQAAVMLFAWLVSQHTAGRAERVRTILRGVAVSGALSAMYGIAQYFGWDPFLPAAAYHVGEGIWTIVRPPGTMGYVSYFATWLLAVSFLSMALHSMETGAAWRRMALAAAALAAVAMVLTGTRAAVVGLAGGAAVWLYRSGFRVTRRMVAAAAVLLVAAGAFYFSPAGWKLRSRARWFVEDPWGGPRPTLWRDSLRMGIAGPVAGYGPEVFTAAFPRFESKTLAQAYPDFSYESPHNMFLDALAGQGLPGLAILCALCLVGLRKPRDSATAWISGGVAAGMIAQQFTVFIVPTALIFYVTIALAAGSEAGHSRSRNRPMPLTLCAGETAGATNPSRVPATGGAGASACPSDSLTAPLVRGRRPHRPSSHSAEGPPHDKVSGIGRKRLPHLIFAPMALALIYLAVRFTVADRALALARRGVESGDLAVATAQYERYQRWRLPGTAADLWYSRSLINLAMKSPNRLVKLQAALQAVSAGLQATTSAEDPFDAWYSVAEVYAAENDPARTESSLRSAIAASPNWFKPHWALAQLLRMESRMDDAEREAALAVELNGGKDPEVARTLAEFSKRSEHR